MSRFSDDQVDLSVLKNRAFNYRWAELEDGVIPLTAADSDFPVAQEIQDTLIDYIKDGYLSYTPKLGSKELRVAIQQHLAVKKNEKVSENNILPIDSAARGLFIIAESVLKPGDEAIVFNPVDFLFRHSMKRAGAKLIEYPVKLLDESMDLSDLESYITPKTKMIGLCNPHNPLGLLYSKENLQLLLNLAEKHNLYIMNDEIWSDIIFPEKEFISILAVDPDKNDRVLSVYGFSKAFSIAGLRVGCVYCDNQELFDKMVEVSCVMSTAGGVSSLSQVAATACLTKAGPWLESFMEHLSTMRDYACARINKMPNINCRTPEATFLIYADIRKFAISSEEFCDFMKERVKLALVPGGAYFFGSESEGFIRICFSTSKAILEEGLNRLESGITMLLEEKVK